VNVTIFMGNAIFPTEVLTVTILVTALIAAWTTDDDPRITRVGRNLRRTTLDKLPEIIRIWRSDMNFVGPWTLDLDEQNHWNNLCSGLTNDRAFGQVSPNWLQFMIKSMTRTRIPVRHGIPPSTRSVPERPTCLSFNMEYCICSEGPSIGKDQARKLEIKSA